LLEILTNDNQQYETEKLYNGLIKHKVEPMIIKSL